MVNVIKMCLCWDIELMCVCEWSVTVKLNFENRVAHHRIIWVRVLCMLVWAVMTKPHTCNGGFVYPTSICEHKLTYHILTMALPHSTQQNPRELSHTYTHIKIAPLVWDKKKISFSQNDISSQQKKILRNKKRKKGITTIENWWMAKHNLFAIFHIFHTL